jgi:hypothetical protein
MYGTFMWDVTTSFQILLYSSFMVMIAECCITFTVGKALFLIERIAI